MKQTRRWSLRVLLWIVPLAILYLYFAGQVSKEISNKDQVAIEKLQLGNSCAELTGFEAEVVCVRAVQAAIKSLVPDPACPPRGSIIEPSEFLERQKGCCYDRARFTEKALMHYGFQTRHVALYDTQRYGLLGLLFPAVRSHATSEVNTARGWMGVDSNFPFLLLTRDGRPLTYRTYATYKNQIADTLLPADFYQKNLQVIYGPYSVMVSFMGPTFRLPNLKSMKSYLTFRISDC